MKQQQPRVIGNGFPTGNEKYRRDDEENLSKRSETPEKPVTSTNRIASILSSANAQTLEEIAFLLKLVIGVLLTGYFFAWIYFVIPSWRNRRLQAELQARAPAPVYVQDSKA
jgi:hypothetical protein